MTPAALGPLLLAASPDAVVHRAPTQWVAHAVFAAVVLLIVLLVGAGMARGWRRRLRRQGDIPPLPSPPAAVERSAAGRGTAGVVLGTTSAGQWLDRIAVHGLGQRAAGSVAVDPAGVLLTRRGVPDIWIERSALRGVVADRAAAGRLIGGTGVLVVTWQHGPALLDTAFRTAEPEEQAALGAAIAALLPDPVPPTAPPAPAPAPAALPAAPPAPLPAPPPQEVPAVTAVPTAASARAATVLARVGRPALYVLEDGTVFRGYGFGADGEAFGEAVFCTAMTGYQETLTDPSYHRQVVAMTAPHIGNTGMNDEDPESRRIWVAGFVVRDPSPRPSNWRARRSLPDQLVEQGIVAIAGVDTRALTRHLRDRGPMRVGISTTETDPQALLARVRQQPAMDGSDLVREVTTDRVYVVPPVGEKKYSVVAVDLGIKSNTPRLMAERGIEVRVVPATTSAAEIRALRPDGVFFSNGPGDPAACGYVVDTLRDLLGSVPVFGICMGNQMLGRALGLGTYKLPFGHRGVNQPVGDLETGTVAITSHNHGYAVDAPEGVFDTPYGRATASHRGLNDGCVEGIRLLDLPAFSVQYHPEAAPGPHDAIGLFDTFTQLMDSHDPLATARRGGA